MVFAVHLNTSSMFKPYQAQVRHGGKKVSLGSFATAEEAALCVARSPEGQAAAKKAAAAPPPLTSEEARQQAQAEGLTLVVAKNKTGYFGVRLNPRCKSKPYEARVHRGEQVSLGHFVTAEEAALHVARAAAERAAAAESQGMSPAVSSGTTLKEEGVVPPMPSDAYIKVEVVVKQEEGSDGRPKRQRVK